MGKTPFGETTPFKAKVYSVEKPKISKAKEEAMARDIQILRSAIAKSFIEAGIVDITEEKNATLAESWVQWCLTTPKTTND